MRMLRRVCLATVLVVVDAASASAQEMSAEVIHWWTNPGESAALQVFADKFDEGGGEWINIGIEGGDNARTAGIDRILDGEPPTAMQLNIGLQFDELVANGHLRDLEEVAGESRWRDVLPPGIVDATMRDGRFYAVPVNIHGENWLWYNAKVLADAGIEPPTSYAELIAAGPKLEAAGVVPLALGGQTWQERITFYAMLLGEGGADLYEAVLRDQDVDLVRSDGFRHVAEMFGQLRDLVDEGSPGRNWNDATNMVITGKAAMQIMGDWAKGEFIAAHMTLGKDYGCILPGKENGYLMGGDVFVFPKVDDPAQQKAQLALATIMLDPETQVAFNMKKGSVPVRVDVDVSAMDACAQEGMALMHDPTKQIQSDIYLLTPDLRAALDNVIDAYWNTSSMSVDTFVDSFVSAIETAG
jgi:glucose/mannose transport system substrate-binding protein